MFRQKGFADNNDLMAEELATPLPIFRESCFQNFQKFQRVRRIHHNPEFTLKEFFQIKLFLENLTAPALR